MQLSETESNPRYLSLIRKHIIKLFGFEMISFFVTICSSVFCIYLILLLTDCLMEIILYSCLSDWLNASKAQRPTVGIGSNKGLWQHHRAENLYVILKIKIFYYPRKFWWNISDCLRLKQGYINKLFNTKFQIETY